MTASSRLRGPSALLLGAALLAGLSAVAAAAAAAGPRASGEGNFIEMGFTGEIGKSTVAFEAAGQGGSASGHLEYTFRPAHLTLQIEIDCLDVHGRTAVIGGRTTETTSVTFPTVEGSDTIPLRKGTQVVLAIADNGNGDARRPDRISDVRVDVDGTGPDCHDSELDPVHPVSGDFQARA